MKNIIVFLLDTARATDVYGDRALTNINSIATKGTVYESAIAPGSWTAPSHASMFTGRLVSQIPGVSMDFFNNGTYKIDPWMVKTKFLNGYEGTVAGRLGDLGYKSVLMSNNPFVTSFTNLGAGFDKVFDIWMQSNVKYNKSLADRFSFVLNSGPDGKMRLYKTVNTLTRFMPKKVFDDLYLSLRISLDRGVARTDGTHMLDRGVEDTIAALKNYIKHEYDYRDHFVFINLIEAHENYPIDDDEIVQDKWLYMSGILNIGEDLLKKLHRGYLSRLKYLDKGVGKMISILKSAGLLEDALVIITSDHGQFFGEHNLLYHSLFPYNEEITVPLIYAEYLNGKQVRSGKIMQQTVSLKDFGTELGKSAKAGKEPIWIKSGNLVISEHAGISEGWDEALLIMLKKRSENANSIYMAKKANNVKATAAFYNGMKLMHFSDGRKDELYDMRKDPIEANNIIDKKRADAHYILGKLKRMTTSV